MNVMLKWCLVGLPLLNFCINAQLNDEANQPPPHDISKVLRKYEILDTKDIQRRILKKGTAAAKTKYNRVEEIAFKGLGREFKLYLTPQQGLVDPNFRVTVVSGENTRFSDPHFGAFYHGHVFGELRSDVSAYFDTDDSLSATINIDDIAYIVEPAWRHLPGAKRGQSILYKAADVQLAVDGRQEGKQSCNYVKLSSQASGLDESSFHVLGKRSISDEKDGDKSSLSAGVGNISVLEEAAVRGRVYKPHWFPKNRCGLKLVADYRFYKNIGDSNEATTVKYLIGLIGRVNQIFQRTVWRDYSRTSADGEEFGFSDMGFVIKNITVHSTYTPAKYGRVHYNMEASDRWNASELLRVHRLHDLHSWGLLFQQFSAAEGTPPSEYCLSHLFTYRSFVDGILGLGYIAHPGLGRPGGICSESMKPDGGIFPNTALSSGKSSYGQGAVITREADLVTAHEFGHNWGSPHDPEECSPRLADGGPFIMYSYSVSGYDANNEKFSPCSIRSIKSVLLAKSNFCFEEASSSFCGNMQVEPLEECDAGMIGLLGNDTCCTAKCGFKPGAICR